MIRRVISFILSFVMLFTVAIQLPLANAVSVVENDLNNKDGALPDKQGDIAAPQKSAYLADIGEVTYSSQDGSLRTPDRVLVPGGVGQIACTDRLVYFASGREIRTYNISSGAVSLICSAENEIISFVLCGDDIYTFDGGSISRAGSEKVLDMTGSIYARISGHDWISVDLSLCLFFDMRSEKEFLLYFDNPDFDPEDSYSESDQRLEYLYVAGKDYMELTADGDLFDDSADSILYDADSSYKIGKSEFPLDEFPVGSFFSKNRKSCTCHGKGICVASGSNCNCMRFWPTGVSSTCEIDLKSSQCWGFAEFCEYRAYGYIDKNSPNLFYNAFGSKLTTGNFTINTIKDTFTTHGAGGHIRVSGHSLFVIAVTTTGIITYECNKSTTGKNCIIFTRSWTWDSFFTKYKSSDLFWYYLPKNGSEIPVIDTSYETGNYQVKASQLNLRESPSTSSASLALIPNETIIQITDFNSSYTWGKTTYNGKTGWVSLEYVFYLTSNLSSIYIETPPEKTVYFVGEKFSTDGMAVYARFIDGTEAAISGYTCSGYNMNKAGSYTVKVSYEGMSTSFKITVEEKRIYPTSITLDTELLSLLEGDSYTLSYTILPADANMLKLTWKSSDTKVATVTSGNIETKKTGKVDITATTENGIVAKCTVYVVKMPEGTAWSTDSNGEPLVALPLGITPLDYSVRYRVMSGGKYGNWVYLKVGDDIPVSSLEGKTVQYQYRAVTASFISDGRNAFEPFPVDVETKIDLNKYQLEKDGALFAGWFKTGQAALALDTSKAYGSSVTVKGDIEFYAGWIDLGKIPSDPDDRYAGGVPVDGFGFAGAELCDAGENMGIRFLCRISSTLYDTVKGLGGRCEYGTVAVMKDSIDKELEISGSSTLLNSKKPVKVTANKIYGNYYGTSPGKSDDYMLFSTLVTGYSDKYIDKDFAVRPYLIYRDANGITHTYYYTCTGSFAEGGAYYTSLYKVALEAYETSDNKIWIRDNILDKVKK